MTASLIVPIIDVQLSDYPLTEIDSLKKLNSAKLTHCPSGSPKLTSCLLHNGFMRVTNS